jgi:hypothetical protein
MFRDTIADYHKHNMKHKYEHNMKHKYDHNMKHKYTLQATSREF